jgi:hypothetical protein
VLHPSADVAPEDMGAFQKNVALIKLKYVSSVPLQKIFTLMTTRVINVLKKWIENHVADFADINVLAKFLELLQDVIMKDNPKWAEHLKGIAQDRITKSIV